MFIATGTLSDVFVQRAGAVGHVRNAIGREPVTELSINEQSVAEDSEKKRMVGKEWVQVVFRVGEGRRCSVVGRTGGQGRWGYLWTITTALQRTVASVDGR
jgi:hypothetical protein